MPKSKLLYAYRTFWWALSRLFVFVYLKPRYHFNLLKGMPKFTRGPAIVIGNHGTFFDPWLIGGYSPYPFAYMVNDEGFRRKGISATYLRSIGAFPKKKGTTDFRAMKTTLNLLSQGYYVCIFPEGQTSWDGETQPIYKGIEKLAKRAKCPLYLIHFTGNFLTKPWWADTIRNGRILISIKKIPADQLEKMTDDEVFKTIRSSIYQNDIKDRSNADVPFSGTRLAEGLERFVWICMHCGNEDTLVMKENVISCDKCKKSWSIDAHCRLHACTPETATFDDLKDWADRHRTIVLDKIRLASSEERLTISDAVTLQKENNARLFDTVSTGTLTLTQKTLSFTSDTTHELWKLDKIRDCVIQQKDLVEFRHENTYIRFLFTHHSPMKWIYYIRYLQGYEEHETRGYS